MAKKTKPTDGMEPDNALVVEQSPDETGAQAMARKLLQPALKNAVAASAFTSKLLGNDLVKPGVSDYALHVQSVARKAEEGDLVMASRMFAAHAITLDSMFAELARRAALNLGEYVDASDRYGRLALKAQSNCRSTLEALVKIHQPREQTVKHVHVNEGGQAVVADQFHGHTYPASSSEPAALTHDDQPPTPIVRGQRATEETVRVI
uniref:hypothetical protein n=1 Tax=Altererythrobacter segetis TaxID=1104773 RepID=UPI001A9CAAA2|nr:hypothetical protein [Altererythrobacter segetis]